VDSQKLFGIELSGEVADRFAQQMRLLSSMHRNIVAFRFNPIDLVRSHKINSTTGFDNQPLEILMPGFQILEQFENVVICVLLSITQNLPLCALPARVETLAIEWFLKVIERMYLERAHGVLIVRSDEDHLRRRLVPDCLQQIETTSLRHLYI